MIRVTSRPTSGLPSPTSQGRASCHRRKHDHCPTFIRRSAEAGLFVKELTSGYGGLSAIRDLTFHCAPGEVLAMIGPKRRRQDDLPEHLWRP